jgi:acetolactate synthase-1/2/3 large subunit
MDSVPLVALTGQVARPSIGTVAFQEVDILGVTMPVTKHGFMVEHACDIPDVLREAFRLAESGRPGPVLIDLPRDVQAAMVDAGDFGRDHHSDARSRWSGARAPRRTSAPEPARRIAWEDDPVEARVLESSVQEVGAALKDAERPVVMAGRGVVLSHTTAALMELARRNDIPVTTSLLGLDAFPASDPRALGMPGMHGNERANRALQDADLVIGLGVRFDDRIIGRPDSFAPRARIVHFDVDAAAIGRTMRADTAIVADLAQSLPILVRETSERTRPRWWNRLREWDRAADPTPEPIGKVGPLGAREAIRAIARRISESGAIVASDVGQHQMWLAQELLDMEPGRHLTSGGLGTMGYALPAALGAAIGRPERPVWAVAGDGGFQMNAQELATVVQEGIPLRIAVIDNGCLGMVRQWQERFYDRRYSATQLSGPDIVTLGKAYGMPTWRIDRSEQLDDALDMAVTAEGPVLLHLMVPTEENVYPMVPSGAAIDEMITMPARVAG